MTAKKPVNKQVMDYKDYLLKRALKNDYMGKICEEEAKTVKHLPKWSPV